MFIFDIFDSLTSQWLNPQSMNAYQSCPSRNTFGYSTQIPSAVQSINSFPSLSNNIGELETNFPFLFQFFDLILEFLVIFGSNLNEISNVYFQLDENVSNDLVSGSTSPTTRRLEYPYSYDSARKLIN